MRFKQELKKKKILEDIKKTKDYENKYDEIQRRLG